METMDLELLSSQSWEARHDLFLRCATCMEMQTNREQYLRVYLSAETLDNAIFRIGSHSKGPAPFINWLEATMGFYFVATFLNIAIAYYGSANSNPHYNCLFLPIRRTTGVHSVNKVIHLCWVSRNHYVQLLMNDDSSPLPPLQRSWREAADNSCRHLETHFRSKISLGNRLYGVQPPQGNNTDEDALNLDSP